MAIKLFIGHLVIQTIKDAYFDVLMVVIISYIKKRNFIEHLKNKRLLFPKKGQ